MLRRSKIFHDAVLSLNEGIYVSDDQGRLFLMNREAEKILGWTEADLSRGYLHDIIHHRKSDGTSLPASECPILNSVRSGASYSSDDEVFVRKDGTLCYLSIRSSPIMEEGKVVACVTAFRDMTKHRLMEQEREHMVRQLRERTTTQKTLKGFVSMCSACKKIRDAGSSWIDIEDYISAHSEAQFSHSICPDCAKKLYPSYYNRGGMDRKTLASDKRNVERHMMASTIEYSVKDEVGDGIHRGIMTNISAGGFGGFLWNTVNIGQEIIIRGKFPVETRTAVVRWVQKEEADNFFATGLAFTRPETQNQPT